jgi:hypothetical protein
MVTKAVRNASESIPKNVRLEYGLSKPQVVPGRAASFLCLVAGGTLGVVFGTAVAAGMGYAGTMTSTEVASTSGTVSNPVQPVVQTASVNAQPSGQKEVSAPSPEVPTPSAAPSMTAAAPETSLASPHEITTQPAVSQTSDVAAKPASLALNKSDAVPLSPIQATTYRIEGDASVVDYDPTAGTIEVRDGRTFLLAGVGSESESALWQDYAGNVHYSCDQRGICTLFRSGTVVPSARIVAT